MNGENGKKNKNGKGRARAIALIVLALLTALARNGVDALVIFPVIIMFAAVAVAVYSVVKAIKKQAEDRGSERTDEFMTRREPPERRPMRREPLEDNPRRRDAAERPAPREMLPMDEYERRKRIEQLDGFLKNGIIDKAEYKKLRARYEK